MKAEHASKSEAAGNANLPLLVLLDPHLTPLAARLYLAKLAVVQAWIPGSLPELIGESQVRIESAERDLVARGLMTEDGAVVYPDQVYTWDDVKRLSPETEAEGM